jgi:hypothetical protein
VVCLSVGCSTSKDKQEEVCHSFSKWWTTDLVSGIVILVVFCIQGEQKSTKNISPIIFPYKINRAKHPRDLWVPIYT